MQTYCWPGHQTQLLQALQQQQNYALYCDTLLQTEGISIPAHSCVLAALSPYLSQKLSVPTPPTGQKQQLHLPTMSSGTLLKLVTLLYSGELKVKGDAEQRDVLAAAHRLGIPALEVGWMDLGAEQTSGCTTNVQVDVRSHRGEFPQDKRDPGGGHDPTINPSHSPHDSLTIPTCLIHQSYSSSAAPHPVSIQWTTDCSDGGVKSGGKGSGGADAAGKPRRTSVGVKSVARMRQMMESTQISIKVKLRRRTTGEASWEVVNIQDSEETLVDQISLKQIHSEFCMSDSSPYPTTSFSTDLSMESEHPQALLEETDEQMERLLEDIMFGMNILPNLEKDCKKTQGSDTDVQCFLLPQFEAPVSRTAPPPPPPLQTSTLQQSEVMTPGDPQGSGDDLSFLSFDHLWLPECLSPLATCFSPSDAQVSENDRTGIPRPAWFPEVPASTHFLRKKRRARRRQDTRRSTGTSKEEEEEESSNSEKTTKKTNQQIPKCSVNLLVTHQNLRGALLGQSGATNDPSGTQPRITTRRSARKTQLLPLKKGTASSAVTLRLRRPPNIKVENVEDMRKDAEIVEKMETNVDPVEKLQINDEHAKRNVQNIESQVKNKKKKVENMKKNVENNMKKVENMKKKVENMKKNVENNMKDVEIKEKNVENITKNVIKMKKMVENLKNVENDVKAVKIKEENMENIKRKVKKTKKNVEKFKKNVENNMKDVEIKEKNVENITKNVKKRKKMVENLKNVENDVKAVKIKEENMENIKRKVKKTKKNMEKCKKNVENNMKDMEIKEKNVEKDVDNVRKEEQGALKRRNRKRKQDVGRGDTNAIPRNRKRKQEKEAVMDDKEVSIAETLEPFPEIVQQQTFKRRRSQGTMKKTEVSTAMEDEGQRVKTTEEERESGRISAARISEEEEKGSEEAESRLNTADEVGSDEGQRKTMDEEEVDVVLCSPSKDTPTCVSHAHSEDTCVSPAHSEDTEEDEDEEEDVDVMVD